MGASSGLRRPDARGRMGRPLVGTWGSRSETRGTGTSGDAAGPALLPDTEEAVLGPVDTGRRAVGGIGIN